MNTNTSYQTLESNAIRYILKIVQEYESVKQGSHQEFTFVKDLFKTKGVCSQNFHKFYRRYLAADRDETKLLPRIRGPKPKYMNMPCANDPLDICNEILEYRKQGHNKFVISAALAKNNTTKKPCSASTIYRIFVKHGMSRLTPAIKEEKRKIVREQAGSLIHIDCHYLPKGIVKEFPHKRFYILGAIDDYSRIVWTEVITSLKAIDVTFAMMDILLGLSQRYEIKATEAMTDNGSEFCGILETHPFERLLQHFAIKHRRTKPYRPQTNGKIERFWRTFDDEVIEGTEFETLEQLKDAVLGHIFYYNEHRPHQGINGKIPLSQLSNATDNAEPLRLGTI